jgi:hypothetical protein
LKKKYEHLVSKEALDQAYRDEGQRVFGEFHILKPPVTLSEAKSHPDATYGALIDVKHLKDGVPRVRIVFDGAHLYVYKNGRFVLVDAKKHFKVLILELRRRPTNCTQVKLVQFFGEMFLLERVFFDIKGAYF